MKGVTWLSLDDTTETINKKNIKIVSSFPFVPSSVLYTNQKIEWTFWINYNIETIWLPCGRDDSSADNYS